jgi:hypothetical protein
MSANVDLVTTFRQSAEIPAETSNQLELNISPVNR